MCISGRSAAWLLSCVLLAAGALAGIIYTLGGTGVLACWDAKTGEVAWKVDTLTEFKAPNLSFGISVSPLRDDQGAATGSVINFQDLTDLRQLEREHPLAEHRDPRAGPVGRDLEPHLDVTARVRGRGAAAQQRPRALARDAARRGREQPGCHGDRRRGKKRFNTAKRK
mgnify:CR=1 FL=1